MTKEEIEKIINQILKYDLTSTLGNKDEFIKWLNSLDDTSINNFINLNIDKDKVINKEVLINKNLLKCSDYETRLNYIFSINDKESSHLLTNLCKTNFLNSKYFYTDIDKIKSCINPIFALRVISKEEFIKSPYHDEDLNLIVSLRKDTKEDYNAIASSLVETAINKDSIKSKHHRKDMMSIYSSSPSIAWHLANLATSPESLKDKYHRENMLLLEENPISRTYLLKAMTKEKIIRSKTYREDINALLSATSEQKTSVMYDLIDGEENSYEYLMNHSYDAESTFSYYKRKHKDEYINLLYYINEIPDGNVINYSKLLLNTNFLNSKYKDFDLAVLKEVTNRHTLEELTRLSTKKPFINNPYHKEDYVLISKERDKLKLAILDDIATNPYNYNSNNHLYDMKYIYNLDIYNISEEILKEIDFYVGNKNGIDSKEHIESLEKLKKGILVERKNVLYDYLIDIKEGKEEIPKVKEKEYTKFRRFK